MDDSEWGRGGGEQFFQVVGNLKGFISKGNRKNGKL